MKASTNTIDFGGMNDALNSDWICEFIGSEDLTKQSEVLQHSGSYPGFDPLKILYGNWDKIEWDGLHGFGNQFHLITVDMKEEVFVTVVHCQGRHHYPHNLKSLEVFIGNNQEPELTTISGFKAFAPQTVMLCGQTPYPQMIKEQIFHIPCIEVLLGRYLGIRMQGSHATLARVGITAIRKSMIEIN